METSTDIFKKISFFSDPNLKAELLQHGKTLSLNKGDVVVRDGQYVKFLPIVLSGAIRVYQQKEDREISLYHVKAEETCTMSLAAAYFNNKSTSHGVATEPTEVLVFPADLVMQWQLKYPAWNTYMMHMFRKRYDDLINAFEDIVFEHIDTRVLEYLKKKSREAGSPSVNLSHQELASELGTTRVVISRILKDYEKQNMVRLYRGRIDIL
ncbi:Crp/Fnr family transcriptional regulator [Mucilaginibacter mali]|uniref:Crp/Fnr family transcriptional regulator n=1 Tax=Mucilaginibacter mali TaxID=2740462 RepID=A0A7D4QCB8_9SPHI|nr:Crp/Fnr family transcriptional regulator [Mucilaginibacter mali]QKJ32185.1 Crp/Fnr family transcriptional regulator [Mucilaginibacter mali]